LPVGIRLLIKAFLCALAAALLTGCLHEIGTARINDDKVVESIKDGVTTKSDVKSLLGEPAIGATAKLGEEDTETWIYVYYRTQTRPGSYDLPLCTHNSGGRESKTASLTVQFTKDGHVKSVGRGDITAARIALERILKKDVAGEDVAQLIKAGSTTRSEVISLLGEPMDVIKDGADGPGQKEVLVYMYEQTAERAGYAFTVWVGGDGVVKSFERRVMDWS
jgi:outer membrane protein assembly factor BamE (lipoprotein component of BamABCDE complex)